jgi:hypothetical protein
VEAEPAATWTADVVIRRPQRTAIDVIALVTATVTTFVHSWGRGIGLWLVCLTVAVLMAARRLSTKTRAAKIRLTADALHLGTLKVPRSEITSASLLPDAEEGGTAHAKVELVGDDQNYELQLPEPDARALLDALDLDPARRKMRVRRLEHGMKFAAWSIASGFPIGMLAIGAAFGMTDPSSFAWLFLPALVGWVAMVDLIESPYSKSDAKTHLVITSKGPSEVFADEHEIELGPVPESLGVVVRARIADALGDEGDPLPLLDRRGQPTESWRKKLRELIGEGYREARVPRVRVVSVLEDPHASSERRLAAAIALVESMDPATRTFGSKLAKSIARSLADPELAHALEELADGNLGDEKLEAVA